MDKKAVFTKHFRSACLLISSQIYGPEGIWAYAAFDYINAEYFSGRLPTSYIMWGLTPHGGCAAWASALRDRSRPPIIMLHPALLHASESPAPWGIDPTWLGESLAFDALLHECMHVHIQANLGGTNGRSSHDCTRWVRQLDRIAPMLGLKGIKAGGTKCVRVRDPGGPRTVTGRIPTRVKRMPTGNIPMEVVAGFPMAFRRYSGQADAHYRTETLPVGAPRLGSY